MNDTVKVKVLFVCMGNICRSPTAHGVFRRGVTASGLARVIEIDCAGTHAYHLGNPPDQRAQEAALRRGIDIAHLRARRVTVEDFAVFDYIVAMDEDNKMELAAICPQQYSHKVHLMMDFAPHLQLREVPDPYYGGESGFDRVLDMVEAASEGLLTHVRETHNL